MVLRSSSWPWECCCNCLEDKVGARWVAGDPFLVSFTDNGPNDFLMEFRGVAIRGRFASEVSAVRVGSVGRGVSPKDLFLLAFRIRWVELCRANPATTWACALILRGSVCGGQKGKNVLQPMIEEMYREQRGGCNSGRCA